MFWSKLFGHKACTIGIISIENTVIYNVLGQVVWPEGLRHCYNIARKDCNLQCFSVLEQIVWPEDLNHRYRIEKNTVIYSVLEQSAWQEDANHCFKMGRKHCNLQCFVANCLARRLEPWLQDGWKTL